MLFVRLVLCPQERYFPVAGRLIKAKDVSIYDHPAIGMSGTGSQVLSYLLGFLALLMAADQRSVPGTLCEGLLGGEGTDGLAVSAMGKRWGSIGMCFHVLSLPHEMCHDCCQSWGAGALRGPHSTHTTHHGKDCTAPRACAHPGSMISLLAGYTRSTTAHRMPRPNGPKSRACGSISLGQSP